MIVEVAMPSDVAGVAELEQWFPAQERWSVASWEAEVTGEDRFVLVARPALGGETLGAATFQLVDDTVDLHRIVVAGPHRRRGLARVMMMTGLHWAVQAGAARMMLEARADNAGAIELYRSYGFRPLTTRHDYYAPGAHALVLELQLSGLDVDAIGPWGTEGLAS